MKTNNKSLAEDITQETFLRFWQSKSYRDMGKELAYLYTIARNLCVDAFRNPVFESIDMHEEIEDNDPNSPSASMEEKIILKDALEKMPDELKEMVVLRYVSGLSDADIGRMYGISRYAVHRKIRNGLSILKEYMGEEK